MLRETFPDNLRRFTRKKLQRRRIFLPASAPGITFGGDASALRRVEPQTSSGGPGATSSSERFKPENNARLARSISVVAAFEFRSLLLKS
jgi:hypothetical protein